MWLRFEDMSKVKLEDLFVVFSVDKRTKDEYTTIFQSNHGDLKNPPLGIESFDRSSKEGSPVHRMDFLLIGKTKFKEDVSFNVPVNEGKGRLTNNGVLSGVPNFLVFSNGYVYVMKKAVEKHSKDKIKQTMQNNKDLFSKELLKSMKVFLKDINKKC
ncbi:MAG: hypothetical protein PF542_05815 [Nanoarchaeota archaeon]|jgi:hypothetical protein|nr:hypothetical protein [Nanoarchaeota archaeon]